MSAPEPASPCVATANPVLQAALMDLVSLGVRIARVAADLAEAEARVVAVVSAGLPACTDTAGSLAEAREAGSAVDAADAMLAQAAPRVAVAAQAFERVSRAVRRTAALLQRIEAGWPRRGGSDDRQAMTRRQVVHRVGQAITRRADGEAAERLFDDLAERLDTLELEGGLDRPAELVIAAICRELGLHWPDPAEAPGPTAAIQENRDG
jgi:hypothetical protein